MLLESYFPFLFHYWPQLLAVIVCYCVFQAITKLKGRGAADQVKESAKLVEAKNQKFLTPDQGKLNFNFNQQINLSVLQLLNYRQIDL